MTKNQSDKSNSLVFHNNQESLNHRLFPCHTTTHASVPAGKFKAQGQLPSGNK